MKKARPIIWSIAGNDSGGGAGLSSDTRAAEAFSVHICPIMASVTAQNSTAVTKVEAISAETLKAQIDILLEDMPPDAIKTGLLGSVENIKTVAQTIKQIRQSHPSKKNLPLIVDPVFRSTTKADFANNEIIKAYKEILIPLATVITPNESEARRLVEEEIPEYQTASFEKIAKTLQKLGAQSVVITDGDAEKKETSADYIITPQATGYLASRRYKTEDNHGTGCTFASAIAAAMAKGFVQADAIILAKMAISHALAKNEEKENNPEEEYKIKIGKGAGYTQPDKSFINNQTKIPITLNWEEDKGEIQNPAKIQQNQEINQYLKNKTKIYAITDNINQLEKIAKEKASIIQLRIKNAEDKQIQDLIYKALEIAKKYNKIIVINDYWQQTIKICQKEKAHNHLALHLGQEDLAAMGTQGRAQLIASGIKFGVSTHSLWEIARARSLNPWYAACGPVWETLTKQMPWKPQGIKNLKWWVENANMPIVAIGGILTKQNAIDAAKTNPAAICLVRAIGDEPSKTIPEFANIKELTPEYKGEIIPPQKNQEYTFPSPTLESN